jgi:MoxR-like ATPase
MAPEPGQAAAIERWFIAQVAQSAPLDAAWLARAVEAFERQLEIEQRLPADTDAAASGAGKLALARSLGADDDGGNGRDGLASMRFVAAGLEARQRRAYSALHIATRVAQLSEASARAQAARDAVQAQRDALQARLAARLWWPPSLQQRLLDGPAVTLAVLDGLLARLAAVRAGFAALPVDEHLADAAPAAIEA